MPKVILPIVLPVALAVCLYPLAIYAIRRGCGCGPRAARAVFSKWLGRALMIVAVFTVVAFRIDWAARAAARGTDVVALAMDASLVSFIVYIAFLSREPKSRR
jgi:hypothetical protein